MKLTNTEQRLVSIVMPTYNDEKVIGEAIESVLSQTYDNWEMLVIDDGSTDNTSLVIESYSSKDRRIEYFPLGYNSGRPAVPRNYGIKCSHGEYIAFLDSDDKWHHQKLEKQLPHLQHSGIVGVGTDMVVESAVHYKSSSFGKSKRGYKDYCYYDLLLNNPVATSSVVIKKTDFLSVGGFDENPDFRFIEDWELWLRLTQRGNFRIIAAPLTIYRIYSNERDRIDVTKRQLEVLKKHFNLGYITPDKIKEPKANIYFYLATQLFVSNVRASKEYFSMAFRTSNIVKTKIKAMIGLLFSTQTTVVRRIIFHFLHKANRFLRFL